MKVRLGDICEINMGQSPNSSSYNYEQYGLPFFQGNADFGLEHPLARVWCDSPKKIADPDDILISVRAPIGALNIANKKCCIGRGLAAIKVSQNCNKRYIWYALSGKINELKAQGTGSTFKAINKETLSKTEFSLPSLDVQQRVSKILDLLCQIVNLRKEQIYKLDELVKSKFINQIVT